MNKNKIKSVVLNYHKACAMFLFTTCVSFPTMAMTPITDEELAKKTGQNNTLLTVKSIGIGPDNPNKDVGFTRLGLQGKLELNANIRKLQLGCGGVNGADKCDIDVDYARFVGISALDRNGKPIKDAGPKSAFELINPFFELAIQNPDSLTNRRFVGMRVGAEKSRGVLSAGTRPVDENGDPVLFKFGSQDDPSYHTGINSFSANVQRVVVDNVKVPTSAIIEASIQVDEEKGENIFNNVYVSRASKLRLAPVIAKALNIVPLNVDLVSDTRFIHNITIGGGSEVNPVYSDSFFISLSGLGDNNTWVTNTGDHSINRATGGDFKTVVNQLAPDPVEDRLQWQVSSEGAGQWKEALRGWSFFLPEIRIENANTAKIQIGLREIGTGLVGLGVPANDIDLKQVPVDNCFGGLTFC